MVHGVKPRGHGDDHCGHRQCIQKSRQEGGREREQQRQQDLGFHPDHDLGEDIQQQIFQEEDAGDHEDQQQDHLEVGFCLVEHRAGCRHPQHYCLDRQQAARLQRVTFKRHGQAENELSDQQPTRDEGAGDHQDDGIHEQEGDDGELVPVGRVAQEVGHEDCAMVLCIVNYPVLFEAQ